ncbi:MAG: hypothetical protein ACI8U4_002636 [Natronomonas sp.]|jgi:hypothetical protein
MIFPFVLIGLVTIGLGAYTVLNASWEFEQGMRLQGVDPDRIDAEGQASGVRRNQLVGVGVLVVGVGVLVWGLVG